MKPEFIIVAVLFCLAFLSVTLEAVDLSGRTLGGMTFDGKPIAVDQNNLHLKQTGGDPGIQIGIPLDSIDVLTLDLPSGELRKQASELECLLPLLPLLDQASRGKLADWALQLAQAGDWTSTYFWTAQLIKVTPAGKELLDAQLLRAEALLALGLESELPSLLDELNRAWSPIEAPPRLCRLNARYQLLQNHLTEARFWAELPLLRIPAVAGEDSTEWEALLSRISEPQNLRPDKLTNHFP